MVEDSAADGEGRRRRKHPHNVLWRDEEKKGGAEDKDEDKDEDKGEE